MSDVEQYLSEKLFAKYEQKKQEVLDTINTKITYKFLFNNKYKLIHDFDPPWDSSGTLEDTKRGFRVDDYETVGDFLEEYTGNMKATHMSGLGFVPETFREEIESVVYREIGKLINQVFAEMDDERQKQLKEELKKDMGSKEEFGDDVAEAVFFTDIIGDKIIELSYKILEDAEIQKLKEVVGKYSVIAHKLHEEYLARQLEEQERLKREKEIAEKTWNKIQELYKHFYDEEIPQKIEKGLAYEKLKKLLEIADDIPEEDIRKVGKYLGHYFSQSVRGGLADYQRQQRYERLYFNRKNNVLILCDPIYFNSNYRLVIDNVARGVWYVKADTFKEPYGVYVSRIIAFHESCIDIKESEIKTFLGSVDIDTATLGMYFGGTFTKPPDKIISVMALDNCIYTGTGLGDGTYEVYGKRNKNNKLVAIRIDFLKH